MKFSRVENQLLNELQRNFPVCVSPWGTIGKRLGTSETEVLSSVRELKEEARVIRRIGGIFDGRRLGYKSALVAATVCPERIVGAAAMIGTHPGVSHNYQREARYNLWYTIAVPPEVSLEETVDRLSQLAAASRSRILPELVRYKIGVKLDAGGSEPGDREQPPAPVRANQQTVPGLSEIDVACVRVLQEDMPLEPRPFGVQAKAVGIEEDELVHTVMRFIEEGQMRRFAAVVRHREVGYVSNAMAVWRVPEDRVDAVGQIMASFQRVSHCYRRLAFDDWPYQLYTMIHGRSREECDQVAELISGETGIRDYRLLFSAREFKKTRVRYFTTEFQEWRERFRICREGTAIGKGAEPPDREPKSVALTKIRSRQEAAVIVKTLKSMGHAVVFVHSCFELLQAWHVRFLEQAKRLGDVLMVGVSTAAQVDGRKGSRQPLLSAQERASLVASLRAVDHVVLFPEPDAATVLRELQPTVYAQSPDSPGETLPERDAVIAWGGQVVTVGDPTASLNGGFVQRLRDRSAGDESR